MKVSKPLNWGVKFKLFAILCLFIALPLIYSCAVGINAEVESSSGGNGGGSEGGGTDEEGGGVPPTILSKSVESGASISTTQAFVIVFSESMDTASLILDGTLASLSDGGVWSQTTYANDTLTISPLTVWPPGTKTLTIYATDLDGDPLSIVTSLNKQSESVAEFMYGVQSVYVSEGGTGDCTLNNPCGDINTATFEQGNKYAAGSWNPINADGTWSGNVYVSAGLYEVDSVNDMPVLMVESIKIYGGYSPTNWLDRDIKAYVTEIRDIAPNGNDIVPTHTVDAHDPWTDPDNSVLDGFRIVGTSNGMGARAAIYWVRGATISNNEIIGCVEAVNQTCYGIYSVISGTIHSNSINGGAGLTTYGIAPVGEFVALLDPILIYNNTIYGGSANNTYGIVTIDRGIPARIFNNTIDGGTGTVISYAIMLQNDQAEIVNNILFSSSAILNSRGVFENGPESDAKVLGNNLFFDFTNGLYYDGTGLGDLNTHFDFLCLDGVPGNVGYLNATIDCSNRLAPPTLQLDVNYKEDISACLDADMKFVVGLRCLLDDYQFDTGGYDGYTNEGWEFNTDKDGNPRTEPWSIGAYEYDSVGM